MGAPYARPRNDTLNLDRSVKITVNGQPRVVPDQITVAQLLEQLQLADRYVAVEVNLQLVPRQQHAQRKLAEDDRVEIVTLVGGG